MRSFDRSMPEEVNRVVADRLGGLLLCSTETAVSNLRAVGLGEHARLVGDVMADVALHFGPIAERRSRALERFGLQPGSYVLATSHRAGNVDDPAALSRLAELLHRTADRFGPLLFPVHPRTRTRLARTGLLHGLERARGIRLCEPLGYLDFACLTRAARVVLTDSGGLQKEAYLAGVPCITLREQTEWVETVDSGWNRLAGLDPERALAALTDLLDSCRERPGRRYTATAKRAGAAWKSYSPGSRPVPSQARARRIPLRCSLCTGGVHKAHRKRIKRRVRPASDARRRPPRPRSRRSPRAGRYRRPGRCCPHRSPARRRRPHR